MGKLSRRIVGMACVRASRVAVLSCRVVLGLLVIAGPVAAAPELRLEPVVEGLEAPVFLTHAGDGSGRLFVVEQAGRVLILEQGAAAGGALPRHPRPGPGRRRARPARARVPSALRAQRALFRLLHAAGRRGERDRGVPGLARPRPLAPPRARAADRRPAVLQPQWRHDRVRPRRLPLHRAGRRRQRRRSRQPGAGPGRAARQDPAHRRRRPALRASRRTTRSPRAAGGRRSTRSGCATPGGSPSTAGRAGCWPAMSARAIARRST